MTITYEWRGAFAGAAVNTLHAECFGVFDACGFVPTNAGLIAR
jgi:hypothetical protein